MTQKRILIANRGEIALRIIRSAKEMDLYTIAVYSDADEDALHTKRADESYYLGGSLPAESYSCLLYTSPSPRDQRGSRMPSSA